jgi:hypothetical protein
MGKFPLHTRSCGKLAFDSRTKAKRALRMSRRNGGRAAPASVRCVYRCPDCGL